MIFLDAATFAYLTPSVIPQAKSGIDLAISKTIDDKKNFNESGFYRILTSKKELDICGETGFS